jgi:hypothetical protein
MEVEAPAISRNKATIIDNCSAPFLIRYLSIQPEPGVKGVESAQNHEWNSFKPLEEARLVVRRSSGGTSCSS